MNNSSTLYYIIDGIIGLIYLFFIIKSFKNGFIFELLNLIFLIVSVIVSWLLAPILSSKLTIIDISKTIPSFIDISSISVLINTVIWFVILVLVLNLIYLIIKPLIKKISKVPVIGFVNRLLGVLIGLVNAFIITLMISLLLTFPIVKNGNEIKQGTVLRYTDTITKKATELIIKNIDIKKIQSDVSDFDIDAARRNVLEFLIEQGVLDE